MQNKMEQIMSVTQPYSRALLLVVNRMKSFVMEVCWLFVIFLGFVCNSCSSNQHIYSTKNGDYQYTVIKTGSNAPPVIIGKVSEFETKIPVRTVGAVKAGDKPMAKTDANGNFSFTIESGSYKFTGLGIPYDFCETKSINVANGDTLKLYFYLKISTEVLHEGK